MARDSYSLPALPDGRRDRPDRPRPEEDDRARRRAARRRCPPSRWSAGWPMYLLAHVAFRFRNIHTFNRQRLAAGGPAARPGAGGDRDPAWATLAIPTALIWCDDPLRDDQLRRGAAARGSATVRPRRPPVARSRSDQPDSTGWPPLSQVPTPPWPTWITGSVALALQERGGKAAALAAAAHRGDHPGRSAARRAARCELAVRDVDRAGDVACGELVGVPDVEHHDPLSVRAARPGRRGR